MRTYTQIAIGLAGVCRGGCFPDCPLSVAADAVSVVFRSAGDSCSCLSWPVIRLLRNSIITENERLEAIQANKMQEEFLANMSHEIRTPLNAIIGLNEMVLKESTEESRSRHTLPISRGQARRCSV